MRRHKLKLYSRWDQKYRLKLRVYCSNSLMDAGQLIVDFSPHELKMDFVRKRVYSLSKNTGEFNNNKI